MLREFSSQCMGQDHAPLVKETGVVGLQAMGSGRIVAQAPTSPWMGIDRGPGPHDRL